MHVMDIIYIVEKVLIYLKVYKNKEIKNFT